MYPFLNDDYARPKLIESNCSKKSLKDILIQNEIASVVSGEFIEKLMNLMQN